MRHIAIVLFALVLIAAAPASMTADEAYVRATANMQRRVDAMEAEARIQIVQVQAQIQDLQRQATGMRAALDDLKIAAPVNKAAETALDAFARDEPAKGLDALEREAAQQTTDALASWKRIGALAEPVDATRAAAAYERARALAPNDVDVLRALGRIYQRLGDYPQATAALEQALRRAGDDSDRRASLLSRMARIALAQGDFTRADALQRQALALQGGASTQSFVTLSEIARARGDRPAAWLWNRKAIVLAAGGDPNAVTAAGPGLADTGWTTEDLDAVASRARMAIVILSGAKAVAPRLTLAEIARLRGDLAGAETQASAALAAVGDDSGARATALAYRSRVRSERGDTAGAAVDLRDAAALDRARGSVDREARLTAELARLLAGADAPGACAAWRRVVEIQAGMGLAETAPARIDATAGLRATCPSP